MSEPINDIPPVEIAKKEAKPEVKNEKSLEQLVKETVAGMHGSGRERMISLGDMYEKVQYEVIQMIKKGEI